MAFWAAAIPAVLNAAEGMMKKPEAGEVSSPVSRRMDAVQSDPNNVLKQGRAALGGMDSATREALAPVLDEAIKKSALERQKQQQGGGY